MAIDMSKRERLVTRDTMTSYAAHSQPLPSHRAAGSIIRRLSSEGGRSKPPISRAACSEPGPVDDEI